LSKQKSKQVEEVSVEKLVPYARNARSHSDGQIAQIAASIREFGFVNPVLIDGDHGIIAGHGRVLAARKLGLETVPCLRVEHLTEAQRRAYILADNKLALNAGWDDEMLRVELDDLRGLGVDLGLVGFDDAELSALAGPSTNDADAEPQIDRAEELRKKWGVETGQLWVLGEHRLLCGDSTKAEDVARVMGGERAGLCFTSPPYGQQRDYTEEGKVSDWDGLMQGVFANVQMTDEGQVLVNLGMIHRGNEWLPYWDGWIQWMREHGWRRFAWYVWDQGFGLPGDWNGRLAPSHEFVFHFNRATVQPQKWVEKKPENVKPRNKAESTMRGKDGKTKAFNNPEAIGQSTKIPDSIIRVGRQNGSDGHPAQFPVEFPAFAMQTWTGIVYEPFSGSGTTIIAAERTGRQCRAIEISPGYVAVALQRWADATGKTPVLAS
jgi:DNA modification methylase